METVSGTIDAQYASYDLLDDELQTARALTTKQCHNIQIGPAHGFNKDGEFCNFRLNVSGSDPSCHLPINKQMFHGVSMAEVTGLLPISEGGDADISWPSLWDKSMLQENNNLGGLHKASVALFTNMLSVQLRMREFIDFVEEMAESKNASLNCMPLSERDSQTLINEKVCDSSEWTPDCPESIGIYHCFMKKDGSSTREHRVFIVCSGGLRQACDEFLNLSMDLAHTNSSAEQLCESEEAWWLRSACSRMRAALIAHCARAFGLQVSEFDDAQSFESKQKLAKCCTETLFHDLKKTGANQITCFNKCVDSAKPRKGVVMKLAASEGFLIFQGNSRHSGVGQLFGGNFGSKNSGQVFPVSNELVKHASCNMYKDSDDNPCVVRSKASKPDPNVRYVKINETFLKTLEKMCWHRDYGVVELLPIVVGLFD